MEGLLVIVTNFILIALLPVIFFRKDGKFNARWCLTALPFIIAPSSLIAAQMGILPALHVTPASKLFAIVISSISTGLICFTLGTHRIPIALWHQTNDAPQHIVTWGAYRYIRHPFYSSFLLAFAAAVLYCPNALTIGCLLWGSVVLNITAALEENKLRQSTFASEYKKYCLQTGRFFPRAARS